MNAYYGSHCNKHCWGTSKENAACPACTKEDLERKLLRTALIRLHEDYDTTEHYNWCRRIFIDLNKQLADAKIKPLEYLG